MSVDEKAHYRTLHRRSMEEKLKHKDVWTFRYRGINCEIIHWYFDSQMSEIVDGVWNAYMYINEGNLPESFKRLLPRSRVSTLPSKRRFWNSWNMESMFDMHGGVTLYQIQRDEFTGKKTGIKIGCDYAHSFDDGIRYDVGEVARELKKSVDSLFEKFPEILVWRQTDGEYVKPELVTPTE